MQLRDAVRVQKQYPVALAALGYTEATVLVPNIVDD